MRNRLVSSCLIFVVSHLFFEMNGLSFSIPNANVLARQIETSSQASSEIPKRSTTSDTSLSISVAINEKKRVYNTRLNDSAKRNATVGGIRDSYSK